MPSFATIILLVGAQCSTGGMCRYIAQQYIVPDRHLTMLSDAAPPTSLTPTRTRRVAPSSFRTPERTPQWR